MNVSFQIKLIVGVVTLIGVIQADVNELNPFVPPPIGSNHLPTDGDFDVIKLSTSGGTGLFHNGQGSSVSASSSAGSSAGQKSNPVGCAPGFVGVPPNCRAEPYVPGPARYTPCPKGTYGEFPNCHEPCPGTVFNCCLLGLNRRLA